MKKRILISIVFSIITLCLSAEDISVVIPTTKDTNYAFSDNQTGRFELYPTENSWEWILFDTTTGEGWLLSRSDKNDILTKINTDK